MAPMLRIAIPYGLLSGRGQLRKLSDIARRYDRSYGHFLHAPEPAAQPLAKLAQVPDILAELATVQMHRHPDLWPIRFATSRTDHFRRRGAGRDVDSYVWCESSVNGRRSIRSSRSCRAKFKIALTGQQADRARGGGARHRPAPVAGRKRRDRLPRARRRGPFGRHPPSSGVVLPRIFLARGRTSLTPIWKRSCVCTTATGAATNIHKARIQDPGQGRGADKFRDEVESRSGRIARRPPTLIPEEIERRRLRALLAPTYDRLERHDFSTGETLPGFAHLAQADVQPHKVPVLPRRHAVTEERPALPPRRRTSGPDGRRSAESPDAILRRAARLARAELVLADVRQPSSSAVWPCVEGGMYHGERTHRGLA